jgi:hypothetical protein
MDLSNVPLTQAGERRSNNTYLKKINFAVMEN